MEIRVLQYFLAIAREETISGAAEFLHITQPTLSRQMKDLEDELGKTLFIRGTRKIELTEEGMILRKRAEEIIALVDKTEMEISTSDQHISGDIYIGCGETEGMRIIMKVIKKIQKQHPFIKFHIESDYKADVIDKLNKGLIDFGVLVNTGKMNNYNYLELPYKDVCGVLMRKDSPLSSKNFITVEDLKDKPLILSRQDMQSDNIATWLNEDMNEMNVVATYNLIYNASLMVEEGIGYVIGLDRLINTSNTDLCFKPLSPSLEVGLSVVWKKYQVFNKASKYFMTTLQSEIESIIKKD
ncbi:MAG: LysR family transcriptional regulator [Erysipelotrichaceae bacterium]|nr:LysR family transcriptional regulator [Erysipelotrichaceae bacterium]